ALGLKVQAAINHVLAVSMVNGGKLDYALAAALRLGKLEINLALVVDRRLHFLHAVDLLELALGLGGLGVLGAESVHEFHEPGDLALLMLERGKELLLVGFALLDVFVVVAAEADEFTLANFDNT